jgi:protease I
MAAAFPGNRLPNGLRLADAGKPRMDQTKGASMTRNLEGKHVAIIATDMVERVELVEPRKALEQAGATTELLAPRGGKIQTVNHHDKADEQKVDRTISDADPSEFDAVMVPGGVANPDELRLDEGAVSFLRDVYDAGKPIAAICHGPWMLVEAGIARDHTLTSWPSLQTDIRNAGGTWEDREVVEDDGVVTSRKPDDIPAFNERMIAIFAEGARRRSRQAATVH